MRRIGRALHGSQRRFRYQYLMEPLTNIAPSESAPPPLPPVASVLELLQKELKGLNASVADKFLRLAAKLQSIAAKARELASLSREATALAGEGESDQAFTSLQQILCDAGRAEALAATSRANFREILARLERSREPLARLFELRSVLHSLSTLSRLESGRFLDSKGDFSGLAEDIERLAKQVGTNLLCISEQADRLVALVRRGIEHLESTRTAGGERAAKLISKTQAILDPLRNRAELSNHTARNIDEQYVAMRRATDKIVTSLQTEDLVRQRVEHIQEALQLAGEQAAVGNTDCLGTFVLQCSQLTSTGNVLTKAVGSVVAGLQALEARSEQLAAGTAELSAQMEIDQRSFQTATGDGFEAVASVFAQFSTSSRAVLHTEKTIVSAVSEMTEAAERLGDIQLSMRLIGVNAAIKTAQLGADGAVMSAIASALRSSATNSETNTQLVIECLTAMSEALGDIAAHGSSSATSSLMRSDADEVAATVAQLSECVSNSRAELTRKLNLLLSMSGTLHGELLSAQEVAEASTIDEAITRVTNSFKTLLQQFGGETELAATGDDFTAKLKELYSMQSEREVHEQMSGRLISLPGNAEGTSEESGSTAWGSDGDLGDGVELF